MFFDKVLKKEFGRTGLLGNITLQNCEGLNKGRTVRVKRRSWI